MVCLRKHYDSLAKKIEKTSVTEAEIEEQLELEKCSSSDYNDSINYPVTLGTDVPASPSVRLSGEFEKNDCYSNSVVVHPFAPSLVSALKSFRSLGACN